MLLTELNLKMLNLEARKYTDAIIGYLPLKSGQKVADIGAGGGAFTLPLARTVGAAGEVYAVDTDSHRLAYIARTARRAGLSNQIILVLGDTDDCLIPEDSVDLVFSRNSFHHLDNPNTYFSSVRRALKPGGAVAVIDHDGSRGWMPKHGHSTPPERIIRVLEGTGFRFSERITQIPGQSFQIFLK
ncbi:class I SAM-dependent methyltransferase [Marispirochaeta aestuarii]|uniref:class I SAM-dependent methyltransferase n=1 Tax=Marispirochaeta aestuarii TaxID=1963862 RepID=UPI0029C88487|nr:class I SAM-dependent methyltransferase [Marispirochaeta aestuarii]